LHVGEWTSEAPSAGGSGAAWVTRTPDPIITNDFPRTYQTVRRIWTQPNGLAESIEATREIRAVKFDGVGRSCTALAPYSLLIPY